MTALLFTLGAFALILILARLKVPLAAAVLLGTIALAAAFRSSPAEIARYLLAGTVQPWTIGLVVITVLLLGLSELMRAGGQLEEIVSLARQVLRRPAVAMAAMPALIGLLPMPGGAVFSAPMVESAAAGSTVGGDRLSAINYWFRHIWEHWWPLYPGVILATKLTESSIGQFIGFQLPLGIFMAASGLVIFVGSHPDLHTRSAPAPRGAKRKLLRATSSIWLIMIVWFACTGAMWLIFGPPPESMPGGPKLTSGQERLALAYKIVPISLGLLASIVWTIRLNRMDRRKVVGILTGWAMYKLVLLVIAVMVFQHVIERVDAATQIGQELQAANVPILLVIVILPFIAGMVTGLAIGFVGTSFPIVLGLVAAMPGAPAMRPYAVLAYASGHLGMMISPLHLCHVVSNQYFKTPFGPVYRLILPASAITAALATGYFLLLRWWMG